MERPTAVKPKPRVRRKRPGDFHHGDLRETLVTAATAIVRARGHEAVTLRAVAARIGVTEPAVYRHFAGKDDLLAEVGARGLRGMEGALVAALGPADPYAALAAVGRAYVRYAQENQGWFRLWFSRARTEGLAGRDGGDDGAAASLLQVAATIVGDDGPAAADLFRALWAQWHGLAVLLVERVFQLVQTDAERLAAADAAIDVFVEALESRWGLRPASSDDRLR